MGKDRISPCTTTSEKLTALPQIISKRQAPFGERRAEHSVSADAVGAEALTSRHEKQRELNMYIDEKHKPDQPKKTRAKGAARRPHGEREEGSRGGETRVPGQ